MANHFLKCCTILLISRETINKKFVIYTFLHCLLEKPNGYLWGNNLSFLDHVLNHGTLAKKEMCKDLQKDFFFWISEKRTTTTKQQDNLKCRTFPALTNSTVTSSVKREKKKVNYSGRKRTHIHTAFDWFDEAQTWKYWPFNYLELSARIWTR